MREKLIEFICSVKYGNGSLVGKNFQKGFIEKIADHLIANGVTIPVRCKDCKYRYTAKSGLIMCTQHITMTPKNDDFCS